MSVKTRVEIQYLGDEDVATIVHVGGVLGGGYSMVPLTLVTALERGAAIPVDRPGTDTVCLFVPPKLHTLVRMIEATASREATR